MDIRILQPEEWLLWKNLRLEALVHNPESFSSSLEEESNCSEEQIKNWLRNSTIFGAFVEGQLIGTAGFFILGGIKERHRGMLFSVYVSPYHRHSGVATTLISKTIEKAREHVIQLHLKVVSSNQVAVSLYQKHGFTIYGTEPRCLKIEGHFYDEHMMICYFDR